MKYNISDLTEKSREILPKVEEELKQELVKLELDCKELEEKLEKENRKLESLKNAYPSIKIKQEKACKKISEEVKVKKKQNEEIIRGIQELITQESGAAGIIEISLQMIQDQINERNFGDAKKYLDQLHAKVSKICFVLNTENIQQFFDNILQIRMLLQQEIEKQQIVAELAPKYSSKLQHILSNWGLPSLKALKQLHPVKLDKVESQIEKIKKQIKRKIKSLENGVKDPEKAKELRQQIKENKEMLKNLFQLKFAMHSDYEYAKLKLKSS